MVSSFFKYPVFLMREKGIDSLLRFISLSLGSTGVVKNNLILFQKAEIVLVLLLCSGEIFSKQFNKQQISQADCFLFAQFF